MGLVICGDCGGKVSTNAAACPHCGRLPDRQPPAAPQIQVQTGRRRSKRASDSGGAYTCLGVLLVAVGMLTAGVGGGMDAGPMTCLGVALFALGVLLGLAGVSASSWLSCPRCQGKATGGHGCLMVGLIVCTFPIGLLFLLIRPDYRCESCGYRFKA